MPASASAGVPAISRSALIGEKADLTYTYDYLGAGPERLPISRRHSFADALSKAERPLLLVGAGAFARADGSGDRGACRQGRGRSRRDQGRLERL